MSEVNNNVTNEVNNEVNNEVVEGSGGTRAHNMSLEVVNTDVKQKQDASRQTQRVKRGRKIKYVTEEEKIEARRQQQREYRVRKKNEIDKLKEEIEKLKQRIEELEREHDANHANKVCNTNC